MTIKTKPFLTAVSAMALIASAPALAADNTNSQKPGSQEAAAHSSGDITKDAKKAWKNTKNDVSNAADKVAETTEDTYQDIKTKVMEQDNASTSTKVTIKKNMTAAGMLGQPVYSVNGDRIAKVQDIIVNEDGEADLVILGDGDWTGLGKQAAFEYDVLTRRSDEGDILVPMTEDIIDSAAPFSDESMMSGHYKVSELLNANLVNPKGEQVAAVDNISFKNGEADRLIVGFGGVMGVGNKQAALDFDSVTLEQNPQKNGAASFKLSASQATEFETYQKTM